ncbi:MAG: ammonium transporter [Aerococcaceae bacterium]|nr:ammonium transporter [Aerococcaceae bacterium]
MLFLFVCILLMWLMIFGVGLFYDAYLDQQLRPYFTKIFLVAILTTIVTWLVAGYSLAFHGSLQYSVSHPNLMSSTSETVLMDWLFQLCFCLYAVVMLIGSVIDRISVKQTVWVVGGWILLVYAPLSYLFWSKNGWLNQLGTLDFSGGMVVHLSAGLSSYLLAIKLGKRTILAPETNVAPLFVGVVWITLGWFAFNMGPVGELNGQSMTIFLNTLIAIVCGALGWSWADFQTSRNWSASSLMNGMVGGLVASTAGVGFVNPLAMAMITFCGSFVASWSIQKILSRYEVDDVVDSFGMNGIGGLVGSIGVAFFANQRECLLQFGLQLLGVIITLALSSAGTFFLLNFITSNKKDRFNILTPKS